MLPQDHHRRGKPLSQDSAEAVALQAVAFIAGDPAKLEALLRVTGVTPQDLRERLGDRAFLVGVLDFLLDYEPRLMEFCSASGLDPAVPAAARFALEPPADSHHI